MDEDLRQVSSKDLIEIYMQTKKMQEFLDKEYKKVRGNDE